MTAQEITTYFSDRVPAGWFVTPPTVRWDDEEIICVGELPTGSSVATFRESTRPDRMAIASDAEARFGRHVTWGVVGDGVTTQFTSRSTPAMTRLRFDERAVLDTLVEAGVARSRSDALAWCVKLVARHEAEWLGELRDALVGVAQVRAEGPTPI